MTSALRSLEFQYLDRQISIPVLGRIRSEFLCLEGKGHNSNVWKGIQNFNI